MRRACNIHSMPMPACPATILPAWIYIYIYIGAMPPPLPCLSSFSPVLSCAHILIFEMEDGRRRHWRADYCGFRPVQYSHRKDPRNPSALPPLMAVLRTYAPARCPLQGRPPHAMRGPDGEESPHSNLGLCCVRPTSQSPARHPTTTCPLPPSVAGAEAEYSTPTRQEAEKWAN
ncbi:hypothetical protein U9M48_001647 [Paspalum notatum var. saurae]|uniref:Uncharacterized protein n=1 Tax=Paspalum notatum var. saurae TaxID=547442 RepID=A0AAQ3PNY6_PASNO